MSGKIKDSFKVNTDPDLSYLEKESANQFLLSNLSRHSKIVSMPIHSTCNKPNISSFTATKIVLLASPKNCSKNRVAFTPTIPYPATDFDTIYTCMINFQDVLLQKGLDSGPLWCDEGIYHIAKELQLLNPEEFQNIFLGLGGFHLEKVVIACCGKYLEESGINSIFVELEIFGPEVVTSVMADGNYIRGNVE